MNNPRAFALGMATALVVGLGLAWALARAGAQASCFEVLSIGPETENQITEPFDIEGNSFRLSGEVRNVTGAPFPVLQIFSKDEARLETLDIFQTQEEGPFDHTVLEGPGTFTLEIHSIGGDEYTLRVEDCGSTPRGGPATTKADSEPTRGTTTSQQTTSSPLPSSPRPAPPPSPTLPPPSPTPPPMPPFMAGGPQDGPVPPMPNGSCPKEFLMRQGEVCYGS